ncbi:MAG: DUF5677 domain-containing protein [Candidatus Onthovivens sp.]|nr:DUF5677 domain-containing protein [Candidatus Onthovivens sp.]
MQSKVLNKKEFLNVLNSLNTSYIEHADFLYESYLQCDEIVRSVIATNENNIKFTTINPVVMILYLINDYSFYVKKLIKEERDELEKGSGLFDIFVSICADKYLTNEQLNFKTESYLSRFNPQVSTLNLYFNFILNTLSKVQPSDKFISLIAEMLIKAFQLSKCIAELLIDGFETEAFSTWRTLHENECIIYCLAKYGESLFESYFTHVKYALAYRGQIKSKEEVDEIFEEIKTKMKEYDLKSKDMKKFIEYGYLFSIPGLKLNQDFKLNFRDGVEKIAGLSMYSKVYEMSSEISHSSPMLLLSNKKYYFFITLLNLYETFFRLESVFSSIYKKLSGKEQFLQYVSIKQTYMRQLEIIYEDIKNMVVKKTNE